ncbi:MAG: hypothetical protein R3B09_12640 [Nannocystaceae bacterium]
MPSLVACVACSRHFKRGEAACPHCGAVVQSVGGGLVRGAAAMLMGLGLTSCVEALYGVPATESDSASGTEGTTTAGTTVDTSMTEGSASSTSGGTTTDTTTTASTTSSTTASTSASTTATTTTTSSSTTAESTTAEPDYGIPDTTGLLPTR